MGFGLALALAACGPVQSTSVIADAEVAVARAHASDGDKYAIYETTSADLYLQKAREESGHSHYDEASDLAKHAQALAEAATQKAQQQRGTPPPLPRANVTHQDPPYIVPAPAVSGPHPEPGTVPPLPPPAPAPLIAPAPGSTP